MPVGTLPPCCRFEQDGFEFTAACWVKPSDEGRWSLYVASPVVDRVGIADAYGAAHRSLRALGKVWVTYSDLKLIGEHHPVARSTVDLVGRDFRPTRYYNLQLGNVSADEAYVYPVRPRAPAS